MIKNLITEQQIATSRMQCPLVSRGNWVQCIGSQCMAWRKVDQVGIGPNGEKRDRDMDGRTQWVDRGYCGAFGNDT
jgi:hypothetical protein